MLSSVNLPPHSLSNSTFPRSQLSSFSGSHNHTNHCILQFNLHQTPPTYLQFSRNPSNFPREAEKFSGDPRKWGRNRSGIVIGGDDDGDEEDEEEDEEEDRSLDLLVKFVENVFRKISKKARKAVRSVLPVNISTQLVGFSVNGVIILAFLWVLKAFLEVICTLGSIIFVSILLIRGMWTGIAYLQENRYRRIDEDEPHAWTGVQPVS